MTTPFVSIQIGPESLIDEGVEHVLSDVKARAACNAVLVSTHSFAHGTIGRPPEGLHPGHGASARTGSPCLNNNNPDYKGWDLGMVEELVKRYPGIDVDVPVGRGMQEDYHRSTPEDVYAAVRGAFAGGAGGSSSPASTARPAWRTWTPSGRRCAPWSPPLPALARGARERVHDD